MAKSNPREAALAVAEEVSNQLDADIFMYAGGLMPLWDLDFEDVIDKNKTRTNALLLLATFGGSADAAFRIARYFQDRYHGGRFTVFVDTFCKSAGTLLAIGAHELVMSDAAELGPLDVQLRKPEEIEERTSGLTATQSLSTLRKEVYAAFEEFFIQCRKRTRIASRIAADVAAQLTVGIFNPIYGQLEPMRIGENERAMLVAQEYGKRLEDRAHNLQYEALGKLIGDYPSHEFSIERAEARELFNNVRPPSADEIRLASATRQVCLGRLLMDNPEQPPLIDCLTPKVEFDAEEGDGDDSDDTPSENGHLQAGADATVKPPKPPAKRRKSVHPPS